MSTSLMALLNEDRKKIKNHRLVVNFSELTFFKFIVAGLEETITFVKHQNLKAHERLKVTSVIQV